MSQPASPFLATTASLLALGLVSVSLSAQTTFTSPFGYDTTEGATNHAYILGGQLGLTWQQIDSTLRGKVLSVKSIAWRRDATLATSANYVKRTMEVEIFLANSELTKISKTHSANYVGTPTQVVKKKTVNAPDWTTAPTTAPAPFDFKVPFDTGWVFLGKNDFLWEVRVTKNSYTGGVFSNYPYDFQYVVSGSSFNNPPSTPSNNTTLGTGVHRQRPDLGIHTVDRPLQPRRQVPAAELGDERTRHHAGQRLLRHQGTPTWRSRAGASGSTSIRCGCCLSARPRPPGPLVP